MKKRILFIDSVHPVCEKLLSAAGYECLLYFDKPEAEIKQELKICDAAIIRSKFKITKELLDTAQNLQVIGRAGAGMENIDVAYAESKGIRCVHAPEGNRDAVGEHALGMLLSLLNNLSRADAQVRKGIWEREGNRGIELKGKTVGIIGFGNMGSAFAERLKGFGVKVLAYDKYKTGFGNEYVMEARMEELFHECDVVSLHTPLTDETRYLVNSEWISQFRKSFFIINTARGKSLNTADLVEAIRSGKILGACLDVLEYEAVSFEKMDTENLPGPFKFLTASDKVILTPHIAGWTHESNINIANILALRIIAVLDK